MYLQAQDNCITELYKILFVAEILLLSVFSFKDDNGQKQYTGSIYFKHLNERPYVKVVT